MSKETQNLHTALQELEKIVQELNGKEVDVEVGLEKFKRGADLIKFCRSQLKTAENEFIKLKEELAAEDGVEINE